jgi:hypothetical protein
MYPFFVHIMENILYISSTALNSSIYESNHFLHVQLNFLLSMDVMSVKIQCCTDVILCLLWSLT